MLIQTIALLESFDKLIQFTYAVANKTTMREMKDIWMHRHLFSIVKVQKLEIGDPYSPQQQLNEVGKPYFEFKSYNVCVLVCNLIWFILSG